MTGAQIELSTENQMFFLVPFVCLTLLLDEFAHFPEACSHKDVCLNDEGLNSVTNWTEENNQK